MLLVACKDPPPAKVPGNDMASIVGATIGLLGLTSLKDPVHDVYHSPNMVIQTSGL